MKTSILTYKERKEMPPESVRFTLAVFAFNRAFAKTPLGRAGVRFDSFLMKLLTKNNILMKWLTKLQKKWHL